MAPGERMAGPDYMYQDSEIAQLLERAQEMGFSLEAGSDLEKLTIRELDVLVNRKM
jgi:hypothetical protein